MKRELNDYSPKDLHKLNRSTDSDTETYESHHRVENSPELVPVEEKIPNVSKSTIKRSKYGNKGLWKNLSSMFKSSQESNADAHSSSSLSSKERKSSFKRISAFFKQKSSENNLKALRNIRKSPQGFKVVTSQTQFGDNYDEGLAMAVRLPTGVLSDDVNIVIQLEPTKNDTKDAEKVVTDKTMMLDCSEETDSKIVFSGNIRFPSNTQIAKLTSMSLYLVDSKEKLLITPEVEVQQRTDTLPLEPVKGLVLGDIKMTIQFDKSINSNSEKTANNRQSREQSAARFFDQCALCNIINIESDNNTESAKRRRLQDIGRLERKPKKEERMHHYGRLRENINVLEEPVEWLTPAYMTRVPKDVNLQDISTQYSNVITTAQAGVETQTSFAVPKTFAKNRLRSSKLKNDLSNSIKPVYSLVLDEQRRSAISVGDPSGETLFPNSTSASSAEVTPVSSQASELHVPRNSPAHPLSSSESRQKDFQGVECVKTVMNIVINNKDFRKMTLSYKKPENNWVPITDMAPQKDIKPKRKRQNPKIYSATRVTVSGTPDKFGDCSSPEEEISSTNLEKAASPSTGHNSGTNDYQNTPPADKTLRLLKGARTKLIMYLDKDFPSPNILEKITSINDDQIPEVCGLLPSKPDAFHKEDVNYVSCCYSSFEPHGNESSNDNVDNHFKNFAKVNKTFGLIESGSFPKKSKSDLIAENDKAKIAWSSGDVGVTPCQTTFQAYSIIVDNPLHVTTISNNTNEGILPTSEEAQDEIKPDKVDETVPTLLANELERVSDITVISSKEIAELNQNYDDAFGHEFSIVKHLFGGENSSSFIERNNLINIEKTLEFDIIASKSAAESLELSHEGVPKITTYAILEKEIQDIIQDLLTQTQEIKETAILNGVLRDDEPAVSFTIINEVPKIKITHSTSALICEALFDEILASVYEIADRGVLKSFGIENLLTTDVQEEAPFQADVKYVLQLLLGKVYENINSDCLVGDVIRKTDGELKIEGVDASREGLHLENCSGEPPTFSSIRKSQIPPPEKNIQSHQEMQAKHNTVFCSVEKLDSKIPRTSFAFGENHDYIKIETNISDIQWAPSFLPQIAQNLEYSEKTLAEDDLSLNEFASAQDILDSQSATATDILKQSNPNDLNSLYDTVPEKLGRESILPATSRATDAILIKNCSNSNRKVLVTENESDEMKNDTATSNEASSGENAVKDTSSFTGKSVDKSNKFTELAECVTSLGASSIKVPRICLETTDEEQILQNIIFENHLPSTLKQGASFQPGNLSNRESKYSAKTRAFSIDDDTSSDDDANARKNGAIRKRCTFKKNQEVYELTPRKSLMSQSTSGGCVRGKMSINSDAALMSAHSSIDLRRVEANVNVGKGEEEDLNLEDRLVSEISLGNSSYLSDSDYYADHEAVNFRFKEIGLTYKSVQEVNSPEEIDKIDTNITENDLLERRRCMVLNRDLSEESLNSAANDDSEVLISKIDEHS